MASSPKLTHAGSINKELGTRGFAVHDKGASVFDLERAVIARFVSKGFGAHEEAVPAYRYG